MLYKFLQEGDKKMKQLKCEMCGSADLLKQDGVFVCQSCGTKYSVEDAKKMMIEGTVNVQGTVKVDDRAKIENYYTLAKNEHEAGNNNTAEEYCNKILEIDHMFSMAWLLKGIAAAWQTTLANNRMDEFLSCVKNAFDNVGGGDELDYIGKSAYTEYYKCSLAISKLMIDDIVKFTGDWEKQWEKWRNYFQYITTFLSWGIEIQVYYGNAFHRFYESKAENGKPEFKHLPDKLGLHNLVAKLKGQVIIGAVALWNSAKEKYFNNYSDVYVMDRVMKDVELAFLMLEYVIPEELSEIDLDDCINIIAACKNCISISEIWENLKRSFTTETLQHGGRNPFPNDTARDIKKYQNIIRECEKKEKQESIAKYWKEHTEEKKKLDNEMAKLNNKKSELESQISAIENKNAPKINELTKERDKKLTIEIEVDKQNNIIRDLENQRSKCGIFKGKEKKAITERIDTVERPKLDSLKQQAVKEKKEHIEKINQQITVIQGEGKELREEVAKLNNRINEITTELTKER